MHISRRFTGLPFLFGLLLNLLASAAVAQKPSQAQVSAIKQSCRSDYQSLCSGVPPGGSAALQCLQQHQADLSSLCQSAVAGVSSSASGTGGGRTAGNTPATPQPRTAMSPRQEMALVRNACGGDFHAYCSGIRLGEGRAIGCLTANEQRLSPSCRGALAETHGGR